MGDDDVKIWPCLELAVCSILKRTYLVLIKKILLFLCWRTRLQFTYSVLLWQERQYGPTITVQESWIPYFANDLLFSIRQIMFLSLSVLIVKLGIAPVQWLIVVKRFPFVNIEESLSFIILFCQSREDFFLLNSIH